MEKLKPKQLQRLQRKRAKLAASLQIARINDKDKEVKLQASMQSGTNKPSHSVSNVTAMADSNCKRHYSEEIDNANSETCIKEEDELESQTNKKPRLNNEEYLKQSYLKMQQELRDRQKRLKDIPNLTLKDVGRNAIIDDNNIGQRIPIFFNDVRHLLLYSLFGQKIAQNSPRWCKLEKYKKVSQTVVLVIEGLSSYHFITNESMFPHVKDNLKYRLEIVTPGIYGGSIVEELAAVPSIRTQYNKLISHSQETALQMNRNFMKLISATFPVAINNVQHDENNDAKENLPPTDKFDRKNLLLSFEQMIDHKYPVPFKELLAERFCSYILTKDSYKEVTAMSPMFALDCEMCLTTTGNLELARISVVDESMNVIYNTLVKPENAIVNYLTQYSGITEKMLADVAVTLHDVQQTLKSLLPADAILIGHSLECDLRALKMMHPYNIDTSVIFNLSGYRFMKSKLKTLVQEFLGEQIQDGKAGHCSVEDSKATMKLVKLKLANSLNYGDAVSLRHQKMQTLEMSTENKQYGTSISNPTKKKDTIAIVGSEEITSEYAKYLNSSSLKVVDNKDSLKNDQIRFVIADNNKHAVKLTSTIVMEYNFILCHMKIRDEELQDGIIEKTLRKVNKRMSKLWKYSAINSLQCVIFGGLTNIGNGTCFLDVKVS
ncbi:hypothetical protein DMN91_009496 [Ooceraea biroi]|uniref:Exonuclease domain-containing protein n=1 Tax=Ooceraea biroi TaxID=2015173 RepID=A0A3L8DGZ6_OOCBI|nr:RNA exonuclease 1 [Ooceraea biroi]XP_011337596.2 RNA exonuclease 1 [Ooceraea biroi]RLU19138.1 hypothetical protein DMN91_009496 [Ooceraea biroi]